jgi:hypothetical protein
MPKGSFGSESAIRRSQANDRSWRRTYVPARLASGSYPGHSGQSDALLLLASEDLLGKSLVVRFARYFKNIDKVSMG